MTTLTSFGAPEPSWFVYVIPKVNVVEVVPDVGVTEGLDSCVDAAIVPAGTARRAATRSVAAATAKPAWNRLAPARNAINANPASGAGTHGPVCPRIAAGEGRDPWYWRPPDVPSTVRCERTTPMNSV